MYKEILRSIGGIDIYPVLSLIIFLTCFAVAVARALRMDARRAGRGLTEDEQNWITRCVAIVKAVQD